MDTLVGVVVAIQPDFFDDELVAGGGALVPQLLPRAAPQMQFAGLARAREGLLVGVGEGEDLPRVPVLDDDGDEAVLVEAEDVCAVSARRASAPFAVVMVPAP